MIKGLTFYGVNLYMDINNLISQYGYAALVIGSMAECETITLLGGVAAHQGLLKFPLVVISVALGGMIGDQLLYLVGRRFGRILRGRGGLGHRAPGDQGEWCSASQKQSGRG